MRNRFRRWWTNWFGPVVGPKRRRSSMAVENLEDRCVPAIFNVNSTADILAPPAGTVTLRSAISAANANPGADTINLTVAGTYKITLAGAGNNNNATGDFDILPGGLTITNTSGGAVAVDGNGLDRIFDINPDFSSGSPPPAFTVTLQGFTVKNGVVNSPDGVAGSGGGIRSKGNASLTLDTMVVTNNNANQNGGGIGVIGSGSTAWTLTLLNTTVSGNKAGDAGGGINAVGSGTVVIDDSVLSGNTAVNQGGAIWLDATLAGGTFFSANLTMSDTLVTNNRALSAGNVGGGIGNKGNGIVNISSSTFSYNIAGGNGGAFGDENGQGTLSVSDSLFVGNRSLANGGAIQEGGPSTSITNTQISGNFAAGTGGGAFFNGRTVNLQNVTIDGNTALGNGGGIEWATTGTGGQGSNIINTTITGNSNLSGGFNTGGGIDISTAFSGSLAFQNDTINANTSDIGGGVFFAGGGTVTMRNTIVASNFAPVAPDVSTNKLLKATPNGAQEIPPNASTATGLGTISFNPDLNLAVLNVSWTGITQGAVKNVHIHNAPVGSNGPVVYDATGVPPDATAAIPQQTFGLTAAQAAQLLAGNFYTNIHAGVPIPPAITPPGEIRGQFALVAGSFTDQGGNLIGIAGAGSGNNVFTDVTTQKGTVAIPLDPKLGPLTNNGGPVIGAPGTTKVLQTEAPLAGSPAIGKGVVIGTPATDERGLPSVDAGKVNVGAVSQAPVPRKAKKVKQIKKIKKVKHHKPKPH